MTDTPPGLQPLRCVYYLATIRIEQGGVVRAVLDMCRVIVARGHQVTLVTWDPSDCPPEWIRGDPGCPRVVTIPEPQTLMRKLDNSTLASVKKLVREADVVHLHGVWSVGNLQWAKLARNLGVPYVVSIHGMLDDWSMAQRRYKKMLFLWLGGRKFLTNAGAIHTTAEAEEDQARQWCGKAHAMVLPYIFDLDPFRALQGPDEARGLFPKIASGEPVLLFLSRVHPKKGVEALLRAGGILRRLGVPHRIIIAGPGEPDYLATLRELVVREGIEDGVEFVGTVRGSAKLSLYQASTLFILPTSQENFGLVLFEALACQTPVVTTYGVDVWKELRDAGATIIQQSPEQLARVIQELLLAPAKLKENGALGRAWVFDALEVDRVASKYEEAYRHVIRQATVDP